GRGRHLEGFDGLGELHGRESDRPGAQYRRGGHGDRERQPFQENHGRGQGRDPGAQEHYQYHGGSAQFFRLGSDSRGARGGHRRQAGRPGRGERRGGHLEGFDGLGELYGHQPYLASAGYRRGDHGGGQRRSFEEDHRGREGRDPGAQADHQYHGGPAQFICFGSDARGARGGVRRQAGRTGRGARRGRHLERFDGFGEFHGL